MRNSRWRPVSLPAIALLVLLASGVLAGGLSFLPWSPTDRQEQHLSVDEAALRIEPAISPPRTSGLEILRRWDERRAAAWAAGDDAALAALYTVDAGAGVTDRARLRRWTGRGLVVEGMQTQVSGVTVIARSDRRLVMSVTDRVVGARAVKGDQQVPLPEDRWSTRRLTFKRNGGAWLVDGVRTG